MARLLRRRGSDKQRVVGRGVVLTSCTRGGGQGSDGQESVTHLVNEGWWALERRVRFAGEGVTNKEW